jgi:SAM-dependent methyltransferase
MSAVAAHAFAGQEARRCTGIDYDVAAYMRYDASVPEDEAKKSLELVHVLDAVKRYGPVSRSLDIGTATGRYPTILAGMGIQAFGIDVEPEAINYARKKTAGAANPDFRVGDARALMFEDGTFDLITCMMGTAAHFPPGSLGSVLTEAYRCLKRGGVMILSTWDIDCPHLTFLSIYSHAQKEEMRRNSLPREQVRHLANELGFVVAEIRPIGLMPEALAYELDLHPLDPSQIGHLVDVELAFRALFPAEHGQMFIMLARKP